MVHPSSYASRSALRIPASRMASVRGHGDHHAIACQLVELNRLRKREANVAIMPGHDGARMQALVAKNVFVPGFL